MHDQEPFETLLDACLARNYSMPEPDLGIEGWSPPPMDDRLAWRRKRIFRLLDGHPRPFDLADTVKAASETAAKQLASLMAPWAPRPLEDETKLSQTLDKEYWPEHLRPDFPYEFVGINDDAQQRRQQARDSWSKQQWQDIQPPTDEQIEAARVKLRAIENPVGKLLLPMLTTFIKLVRDSAFLTSVEAGATLAVLALRAHALLRGVDLPDRLDDVVAAGLLPCVPVDPFDGEPIRYSRERRLIWSVGTDGIDHGGIPNHDYLWQIPQWDCLKVH